MTGHVVVDGGVESVHECRHGFFSTPARGQGEGRRDCQAGAMASKQEPHTEMDDRLPTHLWVSAHIRAADAQGVAMTVVRKGDPSRGTVILKLN
ncbi:MAG: DUF1491 family protein, partial [Alphaproteobacteria bacterium]